MATKQINLKLPMNLFEAASNYAKSFGFRNIQDLIYDSLREKVFENNEFDDSFTKKEIELIENLLTTSVKQGKVLSEEETKRLFSK